MTTFIALLRAVNVGGSSSLPMAELKRLCEELGFNDARTYIQSGNVLFASRWKEVRVKAALEEALKSSLGKRVDVLVRSAEEMAAVLDRNPFRAVAGNRVQVLFLDAAPSKGTLEAVRIPGHEQIRAVGRNVYVHYPDGIGRSKLDLSKLGTGTARNVNTVAKLVEAAER